MAETTTVVRPTAASRPYARAAFEDAQAANSLPLWSELLQAAAAVAADPAMQRLLGPWNPALRGEQKAELVAGLCRDIRGGAEVPEVFVTFLGCWPSSIACICFPASPSCSSGIARKPKASYAPS